MPRCPVCLTEVGADYFFCSNCGARLLTPYSVEGGPKRSIFIVAAVIIIVLILVAVSAFAAISSVYHVNTSSAVLVSCPTSSGIVSAPNPYYDVQEVMAYVQSYSKLEVNVTAVAQCDASGYGPAYLLNGLANTGYWYQLGIDWNWPLQTGGYSSGFGFASEAWAPGGLTRSPPSVVFSGTVDQGDIIQLSLSFSGRQVIASAIDLNTGANSLTSYPAYAATMFVGSQTQQSHARFSFATQGYFTGLMTEWYHVAANDNPPEQKVTYSENVTAVASATLAVGEWNFTTTVPGAVFSSVANNGNPINFGTQPNHIQQFILNGNTISADAYQFVTGS